MTARLRRTREVVEDQVEDEDIDAEEDEDDEADLSDEPAYEKEEGESVQDAQDRIEEKYRKRARTPLKAIRAHCVSCMGFQPREVAHCTARTCILFPMRFGRNPFQKRGSKK